jgi:hypothetical protein
MRTKGFCARQPNTACVSGTTANTVCEPQAAPFGVANLPKPCQIGMSGQIALRRILHQEYHCLSLQARTSLLPMRVHQRLTGDIRFIEHPIQGFDRFPGVVLLGQRGCRIAGHPAGGLDRAPGATPILQRRLPKRLFGPLVWMHQLVRFHQTPRFDPILAKMWVKDRSCRRGMNGLRLGRLPGQAVCGRLGLECLFLIQERGHPDACASPFC